MKRRLPVWMFAVVPAMLAGHALTYALTGQSQADGHHAYFVSLLQFSSLLFASICAFVVARAMTRIGWVAPLPQTLLATVLKLSAGQIILFAIFERLEGYVPSFAGFAIQVLVALLAAVAIRSFARFVLRCYEKAFEAQVYLRRFLSSALGVRTCARFFEPAYALSVRAGHSRLQRPPPQH